MITLEYYNIRICGGPCRSHTTTGALKSAENGYVCNFMFYYAVKSSTYVLLYHLCTVSYIDAAG